MVYSGGLQNFVTIWFPDDGGGVLRFSFVDWLSYRPSTSRVDLLDWCGKTERNGVSPLPAQGVSEAWGLLWIKKFLP